VKDDDSEEDEPEMSWQSEENEPGLSRHIPHDPLFASGTARRSESDRNMSLRSQCSHTDDSQIAAASPNVSEMPFGAPAHSQSLTLSLGRRDSLDSNVLQRSRTGRDLLEAHAWKGSPRRSLLSVAQVVFSHTQAHTQSYTCASGSQNVLSFLMFCVLADSHAKTNTHLHIRPSA